MRAYIPVLNPRWKLAQARITDTDALFVTDEPQPNNIRSMTGVRLAVEGSRG